MDVRSYLHEVFPFLKAQLIEEIQAKSIQKIFPVDTVLVREGQYIKVLPLVIKGLIKVYSRHADRELLLYYIQPGESCIMSFSAALTRDTSKIIAETEEETQTLLIPVQHIPDWINQYPEINTLFYQQYNSRYIELLDTINHVLFDKLDSRLYDYLSKKSALLNQNPIQISHRVIASELGTAREVITRIMKKLESEGRIIQHKSGIEIL